MAGEVIPSAAADTNFWYFNGAYAGTTVPLGWNSNTYPADAPNCLQPVAEQHGPERLPLLGRRQGIREHASRRGELRRLATAR